MLKAATLGYTMNASFDSSMTDFRRFRYSGTRPLTKSTIRLSAEWAGKNKPLTLSLRPYLEIRDGRAHSQC